MKEVFKTTMSLFTGQTKPALVLLFAAMLLVSCSVQKRRYQKGFYISYQGKECKATKEQDPRPAARAPIKQGPVAKSHIPGNLQTLEATAETNQSQKNFRFAQR